MADRKPYNSTLLRISLVFLVGAVSALASVTALYALEGRQLLGNWRTNYGEITIYEADDATFVASYAYQNTPARLYGERIGDGIYEGFWVQQTSEVVCRDKIKGKRTWGRFRFAFTGDTFVGLWNYCTRKLVNRDDFRWRGNLLNRNY